MLPFSWNTQSLCCVPAAAYAKKINNDSLLVAAASALGLVVADDSMQIMLLSASRVADLSLNRIAVNFNEVCVCEEMHVGFSRGNHKNFTFPLNMLLLYIHRAVS